ncbi:MAG: STAS domain-containing protein [Gammaproteobacteria bacterium]
MNKTQSNSGTTTGKTGSNMSVVLDEDMEITDAASLLEKFKSVSGTTGSVVIDGSQVKVIDTAVLQLLVVAFSQARVQETRITWQQPSEYLRNTATLLGLGTYLCLAPAET